MMRDVEPSEAKLNGYGPSPLRRDCWIGRIVVSQDSGWHMCLPSDPRDALLSSAT